MNDEQIEKMVQDKGLTAPRVTKARIDYLCDGAHVQYHVFPGTTLTVCCIELPNGFCVTGESAAASPENFDVTIGRSIAFENAKHKVWALEGYLLKQSLYSASAN